MILRSLAASSADRYEEAVAELFKKRGYVDVHRSDSDPFEIDLQILPIVLGVADAPAIFEGYGVAGRPIRLTLRHQESRADGSLFLRFEVEKRPA